MLNDLNFFNKRKLGIFAFFEMVLILIFLIFGYSNFFVIFSKLNFINNNKLETVILCNQKSKVDESYIYATNNILGFKNNDTDKNFELEFLMQIKEAKYNQKKLEKNQIIIGESTAKKYNLKKGDSIFLLVQYMSKRQKYKIVDIMKSRYSFVNNSYNMGEAIIGFDKNYQTNLDVQYIVFAKSQVENLENAIVLTSKKIIQKIDIKLKNYLHLFINTLLSFGYHFLLIILFENIFKTKIFNQLIYLYSNGFNKKRFLILNLIILNFIFIIPLLLSNIIFITLFNPIKNINTFLIMGLISISVAIIYNIKIYIKIKIFRR